MNAPGSGGGKARSPYDAAYLELADRLQCPLRTFDDRLTRAARAIGLGGA